MNLYDFTVHDSENKMRELSDYKGKVLLIVNTASKCGFTPQYDGLEELYKSYKDKGLEILAFPCNQFGGQEPGTQQEIQEFCSLNFSTSFPIFQKIEVNGKKAEPLYEYLKDEAPGILGSRNIKWNFTKFLVSADGKKITRYAPTKKPEELIRDIEKLLLK